MRKDLSKYRFFSSFITTTSVLYTYKNNKITPSSNEKTTTSIPIDFSPTEYPIPIPVLLPNSVRSAAAVKIQSAYRSHLVRMLVREISAVHSSANRFEDLIRRQETVNAVRRDDRERLRMSEGLMSLLLRLDSVRGIYPSVRDLRRSVSRRIVALQEVLDAVSEARVAESDEFPLSWDEIVAETTGDCSNVEGRREFDGFSCDKGFECLERFLWHLSV